jgi:ATP-dependent Zn protease
MDYASPVTTRSGLRFGRGIFGWVLFIGLSIMLFLLLRQQQTNTTDISLSEFKDALVNGKVRTIVVESDQIVGDFNTANPNAASRFRVAIPQNMGANWSFLQWLLDNRAMAEIRCSNSQNLLLQVLLPFTPWFLIFGFVWFFIFRPLRAKLGAAAPRPVVVVNSEQR